MQELLDNIREIAWTLARIGQPIEETASEPEVFEPWREFEPVDGITFL